MATVSITAPQEGADLLLTFTAYGNYDITGLGVGKDVNEVLSTVTLSGTTLDTKQYTIPGGSSSGQWTVQHTISGGPYAGCELTADLYVVGTKAATASVGDLVIGDKTK